MKKISIVISLMVFIFSFNISFSQENKDEEIKSIIKSFLKLADVVYEEDKYDISINYYNDDDFESYVEITSKDNQKPVFDFEIEDIDSKLNLYNFINYLGDESIKKEDIKKAELSEFKKASDKIFLNYINTYKKEYLNLFDINKFTFEINEDDNNVCIYYYPSKDDILYQNQYLEFDIDDDFNLNYFYDASEDKVLEELDISVDLEKLNKLSEKDIINKYINSIDFKEGYVCSFNEKFNRLNLRPCYFDVNSLDRYINLKDNKIYTMEFAELNSVKDAIKIKLDDKIKSKLNSEKIQKPKEIYEEEAQKMALNIAKKYLSPGCYIEDVEYDDDLKLYEISIKDNSKTQYSAYIDIDNYANIKSFDISYYGQNYSNEDIDYKYIYSNAINLLKEIKPNLDNINLNATIKKTKEPKIIFYETLKGKDILNSYIEFSYSGKYLDEIDDNLTNRDIKNTDIKILDYKMTKEEAKQLLKDKLQNNYNNLIFYDDYIDEIYYKLEFNNNLIDAFDKKLIDEYDYD